MRPLFHNTRWGLHDERAARAGRGLREAPPAPPGIVFTRRTRRRMPKSESVNAGIDVQNTAGFTKYGWIYIEYTFTVLYSRYYCAFTIKQSNLVEAVFSTPSPSVAPN